MEFALEKKPNRTIRRLFFMYFLFIVLEKLSWKIGGWGANIFTLSTPIFTLCIVFLSTINTGRLINDVYDKRFLSYYILTLAYILFQFLTIDRTSAMVTQYTKGVIVAFVELLAFINIMMLLNFDDYSIDFEYVSKCFYILTVINVLYCLLQNLIPSIDATFVEVFNSQVVRFGTDSYGAINRPSGLFIESNFNGPFLVIGLINVLYRTTVDSCRGITRATRIAIALLVVFEILMTLSLTTYIGLLVFIMYTFARSSIKHKLRWIIVTGVILFIVISVYTENASLKTAIDSKFGTFESLDKLKSNSHYVLAVQALKIWTMDIRNFIVGTGYNCLNVFYQDVFGYSVMKAHNYYLQRLCELGVVGFILTVFYIRLLMTSTKTENRPSNMVKCMLFSMLSMNFTYDPFTRNYNFIFVVLALLVCKQRIARCIE